MIDVVFFEIGSKPLADMGVLPRRPSDIDWFGPVKHVESALCKYFPRGYTLHSESSNKVVYRCNTSGGKHVMLEAEDCNTNENSQQIYHKMFTEIYGTQSQGKMTAVGVNPVVVPASLDWLLFFKESHKFKKDSVHFLKTLNDIKLLREIGAQMPSPIESALFKERERLTYTNKLPNLNVKSGEFFNPQTVQYKYDHDELHMVVAVDGTPAYTKYMRDGAEVMTDKEKFFSLEHRTRLLGGLEEAMVLALERSQIPFGIGKVRPAKSFSTALEKVCTSITGGYFREFCYRHYHEILAMYFELGEYWYVNRFNKAVEDGKIVQRYL